ncbi:MAG: hypothetical protein K2Y71_29955 [Xanthobacteraceae bacterium]|nr:hypothetical protein [Xanthobacteraceae bacterium]
MTRRPAVKASDATAEIRDFGQTLAMTQWLSPQELRSYQAPLISKLLLHARNTTPYYKERLDVDLSSPDSIHKSWMQLPILTRADVVKHHEALTSRKVPRDSGPVITGQTSGSTGVPVAFKKSNISVVAATTLLERMFGWWSIDGQKAYAHIAPDGKKEAPPPDGRTLRGWHSQHPDGIKHFISVQADIDAHLQWLLGRRPDYLATYAPILKELALTVQKRGVELGFSRLLSFGTAVDDETRELCKSAFGAEIADTYGAQEVDHIAAQCHGCGEYHASAEAAIVEVLRADNTAAAPGETGRVVVTPLYNLAMPLIRYELGDMAVAGSVPSRCGRGLPALRRILGRTRNMFRFRDGSTLWPMSSAFRLDSFLALKQFQIVQTDLDHVEIRYVPDGLAAPIDLPTLTERVRRILRHPVEVSVRSVDRIERATTGKYEECVSLVPPTPPT